MTQENQKLYSQSLNKAKKWLKNDIEKEYVKKINSLLKEENKNELIESFYKNLEFGTGGMRGIIGIGSNKINKYTIGIVTEGLSMYLKKFFNNNIKVAIAYDCRKNSKFFAKISSNIFSNHNFKTYLFSSIRPTPELSYTIRKLKCDCGIVITASHNPKEYNGYKIYWKDGGQIIHPHDSGIINEIKKIRNFKKINFSENKKVELIDKVIDDSYLNEITNLSFQKSLNKKTDIKIIYTPIHGTGITMIPKSLKNFGFKNIHIVKSQEEPDSNFPTVITPNPEKKDALKKGIKVMKKENGDILIATDPDSDRVGIAIKNKNNKVIILNGNQIASLIIYYTLRMWRKNNLLKGNEFIAKTIVTSRLIDNISKDFGVKCYNTLTGFKYIAELIRKNKNEKFIAGAEESFGYLVGSFVRDKDAIISSSIMCEIAAWCMHNKTTIINLLNEIYSKYGYYKEHLFTIKLEGIEGRIKIKNIMSELRKNPPNDLVDSKICTIYDYKKSEIKDLISIKKESTKLNKSDVLQFESIDGSLLSIRPSGTEPKLKFYISKNSTNIKSEKTNIRVEKLVKKIIKKYAS